ncbi:hypothetical protein BOH78_1219 [Pichia kudriavzevii]|uniref:Bacteriophage T5 Orf172 DNA-binding domain-containing protein n=1 Tax=Pichia kudriavzevii TaxID=4909 RepID=A0A1V2LRS8_PICKU|nr:hypothetical protein BOH78_1219 [Pichia kudriavzevii]
MEFDLVLRLLQIKQPLPWIIGYLYENRSYRYQEGKMFGFNAEGTLVKMFKRLSLSSESKGAKGHTGKKYKNLNKERTCFVAPHPHDTEQRIHRRLKQDYGAGKMYCEACSKEALDYRYPTKKIAGVHTEWFSIPRDQMERVWDIIEYECTM